MNTLRSRKGQAITGEYIVLIFLASAAFVTMTVYLQRGIQAKMRDTRTYMIDEATKGCNGIGRDCFNAMGINGSDPAAPVRLPYEYEPYYAVVESNIDRNQENTFSRTTATSPDKYDSGSQFVTNAQSMQLPPKEAK